MHLSAPRRRSGLFGLDDGSNLPGGPPTSDPTATVLPSSGPPASWSQMVANNQAAVDAAAANIAAMGGDRDPTAAGGAEQWAPVGHGDNAGVDYSQPTVIRASDPANPPAPGYYQVASQGPGDSIKYTTLKQTVGIDPALMVFAAVVTMGAAASLAAAGAAADTAAAAGTTAAEGSTTAVEGSTLAGETATETSTSLAVDTTDEFANEAAKLAAQNAADAGSLAQTSTSLSSVDLASSTAIDSSTSLTVDGSNEFTNETAKLAAQNAAEPGSLAQTSTSLSSTDLSSTTLTTDGSDQLQNETNKLLSQNAAEPGTLPQVQTNLPSLDLSNSTSFKDAYDQAKSLKKIYDTTKMVVGFLTGGKTAQVVRKPAIVPNTKKGSLTPWIQQGATLVRHKSTTPLQPVTPVTTTARHSLWQGGGFDRGSTGGGGSGAAAPSAAADGSNRGLAIGLAVLGAFLLLGT